jgi:uncharacterized membrane protein|tara:strand:+ start:2779 stop:3942 length:1164 start_codon:yes stop_codon:yes gene_type:complete
MTKIKAFFLLTIIILAYQYEFTTYADENIDSTLISGNLVNRTNSETDLSGIEVFMSVPDTTKPPSVTVTETEGRFRFTLVESILSENLYVFTVVYENAVYGTSLTGEQMFSNKPILIEVYNSTNDQNVLSVLNHSVFIGAIDKINMRIRVLEMQTLYNDSLSTYIPGDSPMSLVRFGLPLGFEKLSLDTVLKFSEVFEVNRGFALNTSVPPGEHEVLYSYDLNYNNTELFMGRSLPYSVESFRMMVPANIGELDFTGNGTKTVVDVDGKVYQLLEKKDLLSSDEITVNYRGLPEPSIYQRFTNLFSYKNFIIMAPLFLAISLFLIVVFSVWYYKYAYSNNQQNVDGLSGKVEILKEIRINREKLKTGELDKEEFEKIESELTDKWIN